MDAPRIFVNDASLLEEVYAGNIVWSGRPACAGMSLVMLDMRVGYLSMPPINMYLISV
jgi:hypothetical protein